MRKRTRSTGRTILGLAREAGPPRGAAPVFSAVSLFEAPADFPSVPFSPLVFAPGAASAVVPVFAVAVVAVVVFPASSEEFPHPAAATVSGSPTARASSKRAATDMDRGG
jgi:hypothetical protein